MASGIRHPIIKLRDFEVSHGTHFTLMEEYSSLLALSYKRPEDDKRIRVLDRLIREHNELQTYVWGYERGWKEAVERIHRAYGGTMHKDLG